MVFPISKCIAGQIMYQCADEKNGVKNMLKKTLLWLIIIDYGLLTLFLIQLTSLTLNSGISISFLLVLYNVLLNVLCFKHISQRESHIIYPTLTATLLAFIYFLYYFFLI